MGETGKASNKKPSGNKPPAQKTAAKPKAFMLKMRLVAPDGTPFKHRPYRIKWGDKVLPPEGKPPYETDGQGAISLLLDQGPTFGAVGELRMVTKDRGGQGPETVVWIIPLKIPDSPFIAPLPGVGEAPVKPDANAGAQTLQDYEDALVRHKVRVAAEIRERRVEFDRAWDEAQRIAWFLPRKPTSAAGEEELYQAWLLLTLAQTLAYSGYEASWRLWNLADLPLNDWPSLPLKASDIDALMRALDRFGLRCGLPPLPPKQARALQIPAYLEALKQQHDKRGTVVPK